MKKIITFLFAILCAYAVVYFATRMALEHTVPSIVSQAVEEQFTIQEWK